jgi:hypothetical protein
MTLDGPFYNTNIFAPSMIDTFFNALERCHKSGPCRLCESYSTGKCERYNQWDSNWLASYCYERPSLFSGILLMNFLHIQCQELPSLRAMSKMRYDHK